MEKNPRKNKGRKGRFKEEKGWTVKNVRPEETLGNPAFYYTDDEVEKYAHSGGMRRAQEKIAHRILELLGLEGGKLLDIGCGPGYTANIYQTEGYEVVGLDIIPKMIEKAKANGFKAYIGDMRDLKQIFPNKRFGGIVSVSALQWLNDSNDLKKVAEGVFSVLEKGAPAVFQFYPKSEQEAKNVVRIFEQNGFHGEVIIDYPDVPKNRTVYLVMKRD